jgi:hypothetical protein
MDTLSYADYLERHGFSAEQARALASATQQFVLPQIVTREYLDLKVNELDLRLNNMSQSLVIKMTGIVVTIATVYTGVVIGVLKYTIDHH